MVSWLATLALSIVVTGALNTLIASTALQRLRLQQERRKQARARGADSEVAREPDARSSS
jgi:hypothetical protein